MVFILLDVAVVLCAYGMAEAASLVDRAPAHYLYKLVLFLAITLTVQLIANWCFGLYGRIWRHAGIEEARNIVLSCVATLCVLTALYPLGFAEGITRVPILVLPLGCLLTMLGIGVLRFHSRLLGWQRANRGMGLRVGVIGSGDAGAAVVRGMLRNPSAGLFPVAVFDDDQRMYGYSLMGVPVVGPDRRHSSSGGQASDPADPSRRSGPADRAGRTVREVDGRGRGRLEDRARPARARRIGERTLDFGPLCRVSRGSRTCWGATRSSPTWPRSAAPWRAGGSW